MADNKYQRLILDILGTRPILFNPDLARMLDSVTAGLFLSQLLFWWEKGRNPWRFYKTVKELQDEIVLTKHQQLSAQKICVEKGVLEVVYRGIPPKRYFKINIEKIIDLLEELSRERAKQEKVNCPNNRQSNANSPPD